MNYNKKYAELGLCGYCGKNKPENGIQRCSVCRIKQLESQKRVKNKRIDQCLCVYCGKDKPEQGLKGCIVCNQKHRDIVLKTKKNNPEKIIEWQNKSNENRRRHRKETGVCMQCGQIPEKEDRKYCNECLSYKVKANRIYNKKHPEKAAEYRRSVKVKVINKYGGRCECCDEYHIEFLGIDHKNGDGAKERRNLYGNSKQGFGYYVKLNREQRREDLRVLCHNCNMEDAIKRATSRLHHYKDASEKGEICRSKAKGYRLKVKQEVFDKYGGKCECCGECHLARLAIDHKNCDGNIDRKKMFGKNYCATSKWYLKLKREPRRDDLRVLCHNCNRSISLYGYCPHQKDKE